jgi:hypothetical protein
MEGPKMSVSRIPVRIPRRARVSARLTIHQKSQHLTLYLKRVLDMPAIVDFPTPPFADDTATTFWTSRILRFWGRPRRLLNVGGVPDLGSPCRHQDG